MINFNLPAGRITARGARLVGIVLGGILLSGCYTVQLYHDSDSLRSHPDAEASDLSMVGGAFRLDAPVALRELCPSGVSKLEVQQTPLDILIQTATLGALHQQTVRAWCKRRKR